MSYKKIIELASIGGSNDKKRFIEKNKGDERFVRLLYYALNPMMTYRISDKTLSGNYDDIDGIPVMFEDVFSCCEYLSSLRGIDNSTINQVKVFINSIEDDDERDVCKKIISKTLRLGVTAKTVNKIIPNLIPEWEVQQSYPIDKYPPEEGAEFWLTQKMNGVRATFYDGKLVSRNGSVYTGLEHITDILSGCGFNHVVFDGELTLRDKGDLSDNEAFRSSTGIINSDSGDKSNIKYTIFDVIMEDEFKNDSQKMVYSRRRDMLDFMAPVIEGMQDGDNKSVCILPVLYHGADQSVIWSLLDKMVEEDKEGLMLNYDKPYKRTRHNGILKVKRFYTMDLTIVRCEEGDGRLAGKLGALAVAFNGNEINVGSGFTDDERTKLWNIRDDLPGMICEVKYKDVSYDKNTGLPSLQFPVFVGIRHDKVVESWC